MNKLVKLLGSAALSLCHVAAGWADAAAGFGVNAWDVTAAILIVFVVVDLFSNLERLAQQGLARGMLLRYGAQLPEIFLTLSPFLLVLAALWVVVDLQRQNELVPLVALGYSPRRLALPLLAMGVLLAPVVWADRELVLPRVASLERDPKGDP